MKELIINNSRKKLILILLLTFLVSVFSYVSVYAESEEELPPEQPVDVITVKGPILSASARFIKRGIMEAEKDGAICIIELDTPGGLVTSMREIIQDISSSKVPVIVYVSPHGAMATSAGTYITYSSHVAAMAPGTHIGSAHPVAMGFENKRKKPKTRDPFSFDMPEDEENGTEKRKVSDNETDKGKKEETATDGKKAEKAAPKKSEGGTEEVDVGMEKATNAMVALIRSLAEKTGRNADWGEKAVRESVSVTASKALELKVVEIMAEDLPDLLRQLKGRKVSLMGKKTVVLNPSLTKVKRIEMTGIEKFLLTLSNPQIAVIFFMLGTLGLYYEFAHPGAAVPGIVGGISIILALYTLGTLPVNYAALALIFLSFILFVAELYTPTFGVLTLGGVISFVLGSIFLIPPGMPFLAISRPFIITVGVVMGAFSFLVFTMVIKSLRSKPVSGKESFAGRTAVVKKDLSPKGMVNLEGELWKARSSGDSLLKGTEVIVEKVEGLTLIVKEKSDDN